MIKFDITLLRSSYVYITKVTTDYVYVTTHRTGEAYKASSSVKAIHHGREVHKLKIHRNVSKSFFKHNAMKEFSKPRLASLNYYGSSIVSIEIQKYSFYLKGYQEPMLWQSNYSKVINELHECMKEVETAYINGQEIFWVHDKSDAFNSYSLTPDNCFHLHKVSYVNLGKMGLSIDNLKNTSIELASENNIDKKDQETLDNTRNTAKLCISEGKVMGYYPNGYDDELFVYSPVLKSKSAQAGFSSKVRKSDENVKVFQLVSESNPCYVNLQFVIKAAKTIGSLYGHKAVDFLDIPKIITQTGHINFYNISKESRKNIPVALSATDSLAWLFSFINSEENIDRLRDLSGMFSYIINFGLVFKSSIKVTYQEGIEESPLMDIHELLNN